MREYIVPSMKEVLEKEKEENFKVVSLFAGGGGSSLGYRMAGGKILAINEFVEVAQDTYALNFPNTHIFKGDVRELMPEKILETLGLQKGELDILDGSPPCTSFSMMGIREKGWEKVSTKTKVKDQRNDDLFLEYIRILDGLQPKTFVAENVKGLTVGNALKLLGLPQEFLLYRKQNFSKDQNKHIEFLYPKTWKITEPKIDDIDISYYNSFIDTFDFESDQNIFMNICQELENCGYKIAYRILNAAEYGVPQNRQRLIITGIRDDIVEKYNIDPGFPESTHLNEKEYKIYESKKVKSSWFKQKEDPKYKKLGIRNYEKKLKVPTYNWCTKNSYQKEVTVEEAIQPIENNIPDWLEPRTTLRMRRVLSPRPQWLTDEMIREGVITEEDAEKYKTLIHPFFTNKELKYIDQKMRANGTAGLFQTNYIRNIWKRPYNTFTTSARPLHPKLDRTFSIEEGCLLMSFPLDYKFTGEADERWVRLGNAVAPFMMRAISEHIYKNVLQKIKE